MVKLSDFANFSTIKQELRGADEELIATFKNACENHLVQTISTRPTPSQPHSARLFIRSAVHGRSATDILTLFEPSSLDSQVVFYNVGMPLVWLCGTPTHIYT